MTVLAQATGQAKAAAPSPEKVKEALDETRTLVLGVQVLLGFQYTALFQTAFAKLPLAARQLDAAAMGLMLASLILALAVVAYHRIAGAGEASQALLDYARRRIEQSLLPFAIAMGADIALVATHFAGSLLAIGLGLVATLAALGAWYGGLCLRLLQRSPAKKERKPTMIAADPPSEPTPLGKKIEQMLTETRVVLPGVQALLGFQFTAVLTDAFRELPPGLQLLHFVSLCLMALAMILLIAPASYHRIVAAGEDRPDVERFGHIMVLGALVPIALGSAADFYILLRRVEVGQAGALTIALLTLAACAGLWLIYPLLARRS